MYENHFGFTERPFQLVPNPAYLFLSKSHEEALAHLRYAASQGDGFVEIIGEVGTGKTTLCRAFLDGLGSETEVAYIFNPKLTPAQLLKSVNDELNIFSESETTTELTINLNKFLLQKKAEGRPVILLIDEAQHLSQDTLEQLRLLSNLETSTSKLIQIILVGQPELGMLLDSPAMRQLRQRITLSRHLRPLNFSETYDYIQHRLWIASRNAKSIITPWACFAVYRFSRGVPRLINIACDRALLTAFGAGHVRVTRPMARKAILELRARKRFSPGALIFGKSPMVLTSLTVCLFIVYLLPFSFFSEQNTITEDLKPAFQAKAGPGFRKSVSRVYMNPSKDSGLKGKTENRSLDPKGNEPPPAAEPPPRTLPKNLAAYLKETDPLKSRSLAMQAVLDKWRIRDFNSQAGSELEDDGEFFRTGGDQNGLLTLHIKGDLDLLKNFNLPAILKCSLQGQSSPYFVALTELNKERLIFESFDPYLKIQADPDQLQTYWKGEAYIFWKNFYSLEGTITKGHPPESLINLKRLLRETGFQDLGESAAFNDGVRKAVQRVQAANGLQEDGLVGPRTKIVLYNELESLQIPHLVSTTGNMEAKP
ncbi:MAG: AAA family ATPase [Desulfohalobiaceae bacterium]|nr:AAA family ATPase [Desulfohalobiaceae bacterium]